jgi:hypothetical protein
MQNYSKLWKNDFIAVYFYGHSAQAQRCAHQSLPTSISSEKKTPH